MNGDTLRQGRQLHLKILSHLHKTYCRVFVIAGVLTSSNEGTHLQSFIQVYREWNSAIPVWKLKILMKIVQMIPSICHLDLTERNSAIRIWLVYFTKTVVALSSRTKRGTDMAEFTVGESVGAQTLTEWDLFVRGNFRV